MEAVSKKIIQFISIPLFMSIFNATFVWGQIKKNYIETLIVVSIPDTLLTFVLVKQKEEPWHVLEHEAKKMLNA